MGNGPKIAHLNVENLLNNYSRKVETPAEEESEPESVAVLTLRGKSRNDGNPEEEDAAAIDLFSFYWPRDVSVTTPET